ncbi:MAG: transcription initiation factor IIB, partial [Candidatus Nitrosocaldus sp.]
MPTSLAMHDMGLATVIGEDKDYTGKALSVQTKIMMGRLRKWDERSMRSIEERNLKQAFYELDKLKGKLAINDNVVEQAAYIYRKILEKRMIRGRRIQVLVVSSLYAACRLYEIPKTLKDIAASANVKRKDIARCYRMIVKVLDLQMPIADPVKCVNRIASNAGISERAKRTAIDILKRAEEAKISAGKNPMALAAGALYLASIMHRE